VLSMSWSSCEGCSSSKPDDCSLVLESEGLRAWRGLSLTASMSPFGADCVVSSRRR